MTDKLEPGDRSSDEADMQRLRDLILGKEKEQIKDVLKDNAREIVGDVVIETLQDREKQDGALNHVLLPIVEKSVQISVNNNSEQFVGYLYPLMGRLVRKSVTSFLAEFLEKTNELIENSLTVKGLGWRVKAWQSGVSFSQYVASQTFEFRVEQVLLIHGETGILLNSASRSDTESADVDLVSSMLTAINDFVSDSFNNSQPDGEQNLNVIKTENFSLVIKRGPKLLLVAAVTGNISQDISTKFQITNERIHKLFADQIKEFEGDTSPFAQTTDQLQECLLAELRSDVKEKKKKSPWMAILLLCIVFVGFGYMGYIGYQQNSLLNKVTQVGKQPGILVLEANTVGWHNVELDILRDPEAVSIDVWLQQHDIDATRVDVNERRYLSLESAILTSRLNKVFARYPDVAVSWQQNMPMLTGSIPNAQRQKLTADLMAIPGLTNVTELIENISIEELTTIDDDSPEMLTALYEINSAKIDSIQITFGQGQSELSEDAKDNLRALANYLNNSIQLAKKLELNVGLIIMGASDSSGSKQFNQSLSRKRAQAAQRFLVEQGIDAGYLNAIGLGVVELADSGPSGRKVIFKIINFKAD
jgi:outer membrane protein OmpA-like peptidoglycan-associated protein